ncbi:MAG: hypothetical protein HHJ17_03985 [Rhodoferax sp.]|uniref:hypothetical protein n=1 Tax=Rhodoferax sp. TaxID=50421 RepID=UPI00181B00DD|nr:hypothetical protein [Rhodoferax sp.]NMM12691.1 hypothetical protein [Rhodoferax sp.]
MRNKYGGYSLFYLYFCAGGHACGLGQSVIGWLNPQAAKMRGVAGFKVTFILNENYYYLKLNLKRYFRGRFVPGLDCLWVLLTQARCDAPLLSTCERGVH